MAIATLAMLLAGCEGDPATSEVGAPDAGGSHLDSIVTPPDGSPVDNGGAPKAEVLINEVLAEGIGGSPDWIELYNAEDREVPLDGWRLWSKSSEGEPFVFPDGATIPAAGHLVLERHGKGSFSFDLWAEDALHLEASTGEEVDVLAWTAAAPPGSSFGRLPDGDETTATFAEPTKGEPNADPQCGDGEVEGDEVCDGASLAGASCKSVGFAGGTLVCGATCRTYDVAGCSFDLGAIVINEVVTSGDDWVELYNASDSTVTMTGWKLTDSSPDNVYAFPDGLALAAGDYLLLARSDAAGLPFGLASSGDAVQLLTASSVVSDAVTVAGVPDGASFGRNPNGSGGFAALYPPTPGTTNATASAIECGNGAREPGELCDGADLGDASCASLGGSGGVLACATDCGSFVTGGCDAQVAGVVLNEATSAGDDQIELYNAGGAGVDLGGWTVGDDQEGAPDHTYTFPQGTTIAAGGYVVLVKDQHHPFGLGKDDLLVLRDADGQERDRIDWAADEAEVSFCRIPNGSGLPRSCGAATFGAANEQ
jgi:hypothetical protein